MYFPIGWPHYFKFPKVTDEHQLEPICICSNRDRSLFLLLTEDTLHIWFCKPSVQITALQRSENSVTRAGKNIHAIWKSDATTIMVITDKGGLLLFKLEVNTDHNQSLYLRKGYIRKMQKSYDAMFLGEGIPALTLRQLRTIQLGEHVSGAACIRDELILSTVEGSLKRVRWDGTVNEAQSTNVKEIHFSLDLQQAKGRQLDGEHVYISDVEYSPLLGGFVCVLSDKRGFFLTAPNAKFDRANLRGIWASDVRDAVCVHANHKYRLFVFGRSNGKGTVFLLDPATGALQVSHELTVSSKEYPDAGVVGGAIVQLAWTPDECAIIGAWEKGGVAVWSVFGALLFCSLRSNYGIVSPSLNKFVITSMEWGAEGYQLWVSAKKSFSSSCLDNEQTDDSTSNESIATTHDFMQLQFVKSPLTVNPCLTNHKHLFLQGEDRLYINLGGDTDRPADSCNILIGNKQWRVAPIKYTYLGSNWPIRYSVIDDQGINLAIAGRTGLSHYSLLRRRWVLFGNEAQEKDMVVSGGLIWWGEFICAGCYNLTEQKDEIRFYPSSKKLDNTFCSITKVPYAILLINTFKDYLICLCADRHIAIFTMESTDTPIMPKVELRQVQEVSVESYIIHPMCVTFVSLTTLRTEINQGQREIDSTASLPESILMNVAGRLLMFQRDWSGPQPKTKSSKYRPVPFLNPMMVASSVENIWLPDDSGAIRQQLSETLWLGSGAHGMKVWLPLGKEDDVEQHSFMSQRIMLPFEAEVYPLAVLSQDAVILGAASDNISNEPSTPTATSAWGQEPLPYSTLERTSQIYLHHVLRQLLRRNLGYHALKLARCFTELPYFSHILELLIHEILEEEATSKEPIPDPLLPRVVAFAKEFPQYRQTVAHCARKTEFALWDHLFSTVGNPKALFEECLVDGDLETAASYLLILQNLEKYYISRQHATLLLESALEKRSWALARDVVRFLNAIDPIEAEVDPMPRPIPPNYGQRFSSPPLEDQNGAFSLAKPPLARNPSLSFYESEARSKERSDISSSTLVRKPSMPTPVLQSQALPKQEEIDKHNVGTLLYRHARMLLSTYRVKDLGLFAANLEGYELVAFLRKERIKSARIEDAVMALKQLHADFSWPLPILTHSAFYKTLEKFSRPAILKFTSPEMGKKPISEVDLGEFTHSIFISPDNTGGNVTPVQSEEPGTDTSDVTTPDELDPVPSSDLSHSEADLQLQLMSMELANRGPKQSELELRYLYQVMLEAGCFDWCVVISIILREVVLFSRCIGVALSEDKTGNAGIISRLSLAINKISSWCDTECLGYRPFLQSVSTDIDHLTTLYKLQMSTKPPASRMNSRSSDAGGDADEGTQTVTSDGQQSEEELEVSHGSRSECSIS